MGKIFILFYATQPVNPYVTKSPRGAMSVSSPGNHQEKKKEKKGKRMEREREKSYDESMRSLLSFAKDSSSFSESNGEQE